MCVPLLGQRYHGAGAGLEGNVAHDPFLLMGLGLGLYQMVHSSHDGRRRTAVQARAHDHAHVVRVMRLKPTSIYKI